MTRDARPELTVVMPVFREEEILPEVLAAWSKTLQGAGIDYELCAYDDGSPDGSRDVLSRHAAHDSRLRVFEHENRGHGPTVLRGYREARGRFVFQVDSDHELSPEPFLALWRAREDADLAIGVRRYTSRAPTRRLLSALARLSVRALYGPGIEDPNCPYRLMRGSWLEGVLAQLPPDAFAPNVLISGVAVRSGARIVELPVPSRPRPAGTPSLVRLSLWKGAWRALRDTATVARSRR